MKYGLAILLGGFCSINLFVTVISTWCDAPLPSRARLAAQEESQEPQGKKFEPKPDDPDRVLFEGWAKPAFALFISGRLDGYIEPCGCTGLENQKGGLLRRDTFLRSLRDEKGWPVACIDTGNQINRTGVQSEVKLKSTWRGLFDVMDYQMSSLGADDLKVPCIQLITSIVNLKNGGNGLFACANATLMDGFLEPYKIITIENYKIGVTAVLGDEEVKTLQSIVEKDVKISTAAKSLPRTIEMMKNQKCHLNVLIVNSSLEEAHKLAQAFPDFDWVISANGIGEPTNAPEKIQVGNRVVSLIQVGSKGMHVGVLGFYEANGKLESKYQRVPLDARFDDSEAMKVVFKDYQSELGRMTLKELGISPRPHPTGRHFIGSEECMDCHEAEYEIWAEGIEGLKVHGVGPHSRATLDLNDGGPRAWVKRDKDPECLSCHVTGWSPQGYFPYETGFTELAQSELHGNGCENCHGPGKEHVDAENAEDDRDKESRRAEMVVTLDQARKELCFTCHDLDNSPDFGKPGAFEEYWAKIDHTEKEEEPAANIPEKASNQ